MEIAKKIFEIYNSKDKVEMVIKGYDLIMNANISYAEYASKLGNYFLNNKTEDKLGQIWEGLNVIENLSKF